MKVGMRRVLIGIGLAVLATMAVPGTALASTGGSAPRAQAAAVAGTQGRQAVIRQVKTPYGTITYGWRPQDPAADAAVQPASAQSASGCSQDVCISLIGSGAYVSDWSSTANWGGPEICTYSIFEINDIVIRTGSVVCGGAGVFFTDWPAKKNFPTPSQACNQWSGIPGYPCEDIHT